jgi:hypothetical protein
MESVHSQLLRHFDQVTVEVTLVSLAVFAVLALWVAHTSKSVQFPGFGLSPYLQFAYNNFIKPHDAKAGEGQQSALESFYAKQVGIDFDGPLM